MQLGSFAQGAASLAPAGMESQSKLRNEDNIPRSPQLSTHEMAGAQSLPMPIRPLFSSSPTRISPIEEELSCNTTAPQRTPSPPTSALPLRHPETLGTLISIQTSEGKGLGVFALCDIEPGTVLLSESPLITLIDTGTRADPLEATIAALPSPQRQSFLSLSHYSRNVNESRNRSIVYSNGYSIMKDMATGVFETASRINHSCVPNSGYVWKDDIGRMLFCNRLKLLEGEEVTVDYGHKKGQLKRIYGFECQCGGCTEWGSVGSSSRTGSEAGEEKEMGSLDAIVAVTVNAAKKDLDTIIENVGAIKLEAGISVYGEDRSG